MKISNLGNSLLRKPATSKQYNNDGEKKALSDIFYKQEKSNSLIITDKSLHSCYIYAMGANSLKLENIYM